MKSTLLYIAWPASVAASFVAGGFILDSGKNDLATSSQNEIKQTVTRNVNKPASFSPSTQGMSKSQLISKLGASEDEYSRNYLVQRLAKIDDPNERSILFDQMINKLTSEDFEQVVADFRELGITRERYSEYERLLSAWTKLNPQAAINYVSKNTKGEFATQTVLSTWALDDPDLAIDWAQSNYKGKGGNPWITGVIKGIVKQDINRATTLLNEMKYSRERGEALDAVIGHVGTMKTTEALGWLDMISDERLKAGASARVAAALAKKDPDAIADWVSNLEDPTARKRAQNELAKSYAKVDPAKASAWVNSLEPEERINAARNVLPQLAKENPEQAVTWMKTMSNQDGYEGLVKSYMWNVGRENPQAALAQITEFKDEDTQKQVQNRILMGWSFSAPEKAQAWMKDNNVSSEQQAELQKQVERMQRFRENGSRRRDRNGNE